MDNNTSPDDQYRAEAIKALHLYLQHNRDPFTGQLDDDALRDEAEMWVDSSVGVATSGLTTSGVVMLCVGSERSASGLARAVVQCAGPDVEPTPQDIAEARAVITRMADPRTTES